MTRCRSCSLIAILLGSAAVFAGPSAHAADPAPVLPVEIASALPDVAPADAAGRVGQVLTPLQAMRLAAVLAARGHGGPRFEDSAPGGAPRPPIFAGRPETPPPSHLPPDPETLRPSIVRAAIAKRLTVGVDPDGDGLVTIEIPKDRLSDVVPHADDPAAFRAAAYSAVVKVPRANQARVRDGVVEIGSARDAAHDAMSAEAPAVVTGAIRGLGLGNSELW